jgi:hypothetical protein
MDVHKKIPVEIPRDFSRFFPRSGSIICVVKCVAARASL